MGARKATQPPKVSIDTPVPERLVKADEMAELLGVKKRTILEMVNRRQIPVIKINRRVLRFRPSAVYDSMTIPVQNL